MKQRSRLFQRRGSVFYIFDKIIGMHHSFQTSQEEESLRLPNARK